MQERVYQRRIHDVNGLKQRLLEVWNDLDQTIIDGAVAACRPMALAPPGLHYAYKQKEDISNIFFNSIIKP
jgi:hypothetical protein